MAPKKKDEKKPAAAAVEEEEQPIEENGTYVFAADDGAGGALTSNPPRYTGQVARRPQGEGGPVTIRREGWGTYADEFITYEGNWKDDAMHGEGTLTFNMTGSKYKGSFIDNQFDGRGVFTWTNGCRYEGQWRANKMHGEGSFTDVAGQVWNGKFYNGTGPGLRNNTIAATVSESQGKLS